MTETVDRPSATKTRRRTTSVAEKELKAIIATGKKISRSKTDSLAFLQQAGILDKKGELAKPYRN